MGWVSLPPPGHFPLPVDIMAVSTFCLNCNLVHTLVLTFVVKMSQVRFLMPCDRAVVLSWPEELPVGTLWCVKLSSLS